MLKELFLLLMANFWVLLNSISVYILLGVLIAGIFKWLMPDTFIKKHLGQHNFMSNIKAAVLGIPLPLSSRSMRSFTSALRKSGASKSVTQTFLIATPTMGAHSVLATYGVFGWMFTFYRIVSSLVIALVAGLITLFLIKEKEGKSPGNDKQSLNVNQPLPVSSIGKPLNIEVVVAEKKPTLFMQVITYAFDDIFKDMARSLMFGVVAGSLIVTFIPDNLSAYISSNILMNYALVIIISMLLYVCATSSIPLGLSLLIAGFTPGAALIFLSAGPATNISNMSVVLRELGKASLAIYMSSVITGSLLFAILLDNFFYEGLKHINSLNISTEDPGFIAQVSSVILLYLTIKYSFNKNAKIVSGGCTGCGDGGCSN